MTSLLRIVGLSKYIPMDARRTDFPDNHFDIIFSASVLEHLLDIDEFLTEMHRILSPKGLLCLHGGAFWNSAWGHHLWVHTDAESYEFNGNNPLPDWSHLFMSRAEMLSHLLIKEVIPDHANKIISWVFDSDEINRFTYDDYVKVFNNCDFSIISLTPKNWRKPDASMTRKLSAIYGSEISNFSIGTAVVVLRK